MIFQLTGEITDIEIMAVGASIRDIERLRKSYGAGRWRKLKGIVGLKVLKTEGVQLQFAVCTTNEGFPASLEIRKIYQALPDEKAAKHNLVRVIDESGEDYLYPQSFFVAIELPQAAADAFLHAA